MSDSDSSPDGNRKPKVFLVNTLLVVVTILVVLLRCLSLRRSRFSHQAFGRYFLAGVSAVYFSLISYFFSYLTNYMSYLDSIYRSYLLYLVVLFQFLNSNAYMAALAVAAVSSPTAGDDIDSQKIRPSMESLVSSLWVAGLVMYYIFVKKKEDDASQWVSVNFSIFVLWALGVARLLLRFFAFQRANGSFGVGRNAQLIEGYMAQLHQEEEGRRLDLAPAVPRFILTGEEDQDVVETSQGYRLKEGEGQSSRLVTLDKVWSSRLPPVVKDLCLSFSLFKCLRRRFAGYPVAEAGSSWAFRFVCGGLLGHKDDHLRMFKVISVELDFASDFYYSPIPVASLRPRSAALYFFLSAFICILTVSSIPLLLMMYLVSVIHMASSDTGPRKPEEGDTLMYILGPVIAVVTFYVEIAELVHSLRSNWTKISMVGHYINQSGWSCIICPCLLKCKTPMLWKDDMRQNLLLKPRDQDVKDVIMVSSDVKDALIRSLKSSGGQLSNGVATVRRRCPHFDWACYDRVTTSTDTILVWYIATFLVEINCSSPAQVSTKMAVATSLSRYCAYLVAHAPNLLPGNTFGTKHRYRKVKKCIEKAASLVDYNTSEMMEMGSRSEHQLEIGKEISQLVEEEVVSIGSKLGKELVGEERQTELVWEILADFWSEMILYLAPSDNAKGHIESLRHGGELITLLWALLLHAGITSRPSRDVPIP